MAALGLNPQPGGQIHLVSREGGGDTVEGHGADTKKRGIQRHDAFLVRFDNAMDSISYQMIINHLYRLVELWVAKASFIQFIRFARCLPYPSH